MTDVSIWSPPAGIEVDSVAMSEERATVLCAQVDGALERYAGSIRRLQDLITSLYAGRAWETLGFASWSDLCAARFGPKIKALGVDFRRDLVAILGDAGLSTRAIGAAVGVSEGTIRGDRQVRNDYAPDVRSDSPPTEAQKITGVDGKVYTATDPKTPKPQAYIKPEIKAKREIVKSFEKLKTDISPEHIAALHRSDRDDLADKVRARIMELSALLARVEGG